MNCERIEPLCEAYALNALEMEEARDVEAHLVSCPKCQQLVTEYVSLLADLPEIAQMLRPLKAPKHLKDTVLTQIVSETGPNTTPASLSWLEKLFQMPRWVPSLVAVQAVVIIALGFVLFQQTNSNDQMRSSASTMRDALQIMMASSQETRFLSASNDAPEGSWGRIYSQPDMDVVVVLVADTPPAPDDAEYRFWFKNGDSYVSSGVVCVISEDGSIQGRGWLIVPKPEGYDQVLVTLDPIGSPSDAPVGPMILSADYS